MTAKSTSNKDVIYIDVEEDITGIVEKVRASSHHIVALVLPKRATMLQSVVNMKLLKRAGDESKKNIVLITTEAGLLPLAGSVGLFVAKSLQTKPEVPEAPAVAQEEKVEKVEDEGADEPVDKSKTLAELSGDEEPIELDNAEPAKDESASKAKSKKGSKIKIPNFNKFRMWLILGGGGLLLLIGLAVWAFLVLPKAEVVISTDSTAMTSSRELTLSTADDTKLKADEGLIPAKSVETTRTQRTEVPATGEENQGKVASGSVVMTAEDCSLPYDAPSDVPAGSGLSSSGNTYITQDTASFAAEDFESGCLIFESNTVEITAQNGGKAFNTGGSAKFTVVGRSGISATGSAKGGTDKIVKVVSQEDVDKAKEQIEKLEAKDIEQELEEELSEQGLYPVKETFNVTSSGTELSADVGDEADSVSVTEEVKYTMLGVKEEALERVLAADLADDLDPQRQSILDYGLDEATFTLQNQQDGEALVGVRSVLVVGPELKVGQIKEQIAGKKASEAQAIIQDNPGVTNVDISYGPFWVRSIPGDVGKISVTVEEPKAAAAETENGTE